MDGFDSHRPARYSGPVGFAPRLRRKAILVVGMSRSGTSMIAHVLHALGAALPADFIGPGHGNPYGHWEPRALVAINDEILTRFGRTWDDPRPLPDGWLLTGESRRQVTRITRQIEQDYADTPLLVIKDPRLCRLLPLYREALDRLDIDPVVLLQVRPVADVARSLAERDGKSPVLSELLWLRSVVEAEWHSRMAPRVWVSFAQVANDWRACVRRIGHSFDVTWPVSPDAADSRITAQLRACRWGAERSNDDPESHPPLSERAWDAIGAGLAQNEPAARAGFDIVRAILRDTDRLYMPILSDVARRHEVALCAIRQSTSWRLTAPLRAVRQWVDDVIARRADRDGAATESGSCPYRPACGPWDASPVMPDAPAAASTATSPHPAAARRQAGRSAGAAASEVRHSR